MRNWAKDIKWIGGLVVALGGALLAVDVVIGLSVVGVGLLAAVVGIVAGRKKKTKPVESPDPAPSRKPVVIYDSGRTEDSDQLFVELDTIRRILSTNTSVDAQLLLKKYLGKPIRFAGLLNDVGSDGQRMFMWFETGLFYIRAYIPPDDPQGLVGCLQKGHRVELTAKVHKIIDPEIQLVGVNVTKVLKYQ